MKWITPRSRLGDDSGVSLVLALVFITVLSLVVVAVLAFADTSMRTTMAVRNQAAESAAADGAAQVAINALRNGSYVGTSADCFGTGASLPLNNFYQRPDGEEDSVRVACESDPSLALVPVGTPQTPFTTLDTNPTITGLWVSSTATIFQPAASFRVAGNVQSNSTIRVEPRRLLVVQNANLTASGGTIRAARTCNSGSGLYSPGPNCNTGTTVPDPGYTMPNVAGLPRPTLPTCAPVMTFEPGIYDGLDDFAALNLLTSPVCRGGNFIAQFKPGIYFMDFGPSNIPLPWIISAGHIIAGKLRPGVTLTPGVTPAIPGSCVSPVSTGAGWTPPGSADDGVTFVLGGVSKINVSGLARMEVCGRYAGTSAPLAFTALPATGPLAAECVDTDFPCAALSTGLPSAFVVQGTVYFPSREFVLILSNGSNQSFRGGVVARRAWVSGLRSASSAPVVQVPPPSPVGQRRTVVHLNVYVCENSASCGTGGRLRLRAEVALTDPTGMTMAGARQVSVLSWSVQR